MDKLNYLLKNWDKGEVKLSSFLTNQGYKKELLSRYVKSNWIESLGYGAYKLSGDNINWLGAVEALQSQKKSLVHPGGKTALELLGYSHYIRFKQTNIKLYSSYDKLPNWFKNQVWYKTIDFTQTKIFDYKSENYFKEFESNSLIVKISIPELAILEMLYLVPNEQTFTEAYEIMEGLMTLRPNLLQKLLEECDSIKVKRLFLWMAENQNHQWFNELKFKEIDLGKGKRSIVKNGKLNNKYNITVPAQYER